MEFKYIAIILSFILLSFLLYKEISRADKARLIWRLIASVMAVTCFALLIVPVKYRIPSSQNINEITLLTKGTNPDSVAKISGTKYSLAFTIKGVKTNLIQDLPYFLATHPAINKLNIYGYGLSDQDLKGLAGYEIQFHPAEKPGGIISANWQQTIKSTEQLHVQGMYQNSSSESVKLLLKGLGNSIDSVSVAPNSSKPFSFNTQPKQIGKAVYELISLQNNDTLAKEPLPLIVTEKGKMKVLILSSYPDFEYKFLKKWLFDNHYPLAFRTRISKDKYSSDFLNTDSLNINRITASSLKKFDVLVMDEGELAAIAPEERTAINDAVSGGMGFFMRISDLKPASAFSGRYGRYELPASKDKQLSLSLKDEDYKFGKLPLEQTLFLKTTLNDKPLVVDGSGKTLVSSTLQGAGKMLITSITSTFNWLLSGKTADYTRYWSAVLSAAARKKHEDQSVQILPQFPSIYGKTEFIVDLAESGKAPQLKVNGVKLAPGQNIELPFEWQASFWPETSGWNDLSVNQSAQPFFIYKNTDWLALKNQQTIISTSQLSNKANHHTTKTSLTNNFSEKEVSIWWFLSGFILASAFLWYESRILSA